MADTTDFDAAWAAAQANADDADLSFGDYAVDAVRGVGSGVVGFGKSLYKLGDDITEVLGGDLEDDSFFDSQEVFKTKTWVGDLTDGVTQFALGFVPLLGVAGKVSKAAQLGRLGTMAVRGAAGAAADFVSFTEHEERLSNLVQQFPALQNPVTEYLAADPTDSWAEGRFKNMVEGLGLGAVADVALRAFKGYKGMKVAKDAGDAEAFAKASDNTAAELEGVLEQAEFKPASDITPDPETAARLASVTDEVAEEVPVEVPARRAGDTIAATEEEEILRIRRAILDGEVSNPNFGRRASDKLPEDAGAAAPTPRPAETPLEDVKTTTKIDDAMRKNLRDHIAHRVKTGESLDDALDEALKTHLNRERLDISEDVEGSIMEVAKVLDDVVQKEIGGVQSMKLAEQSAKDLASVAGHAPDKLLNLLEADKKLSKGIGTRLVAYRHVRNLVADEITRLSHQIDGVNTPAGLLRKYDSLVDSFAQIHTAIHSISAETARAVTFGRITAGVPDTSAKRLADVIKQTVRGSNGQEARVRLVKAIQAANGDPKAMTHIFKWFDHAGERGFQKALSIHNEFWINSILSGVRTQATNLLSNVMQTFLLPAERLVGGVLMRDKTVQQSAFRVYSNILHTAVDIFNLTDTAGKLRDDNSFGLALKSLMKEQPILDNLNKFDVPQNAITGKNLGLAPGSTWANAVDFVGKAVRMPSRFMTSADELFKQINYRAFLRDEAVQLAMDKGIKEPAAFAEFVAKHIADSFDETGMALNARALQYAREASFTQELLDGTLGKSVQELVGKHPGLRLILPFIRTPTNIFRRFVQYTPGLNFMQKEFRQMWDSADPLVRASARGRFAMGGLFWGVATTMAASGKLTGGGPGSKAEREALLATGWKPYSLVLTDDDGKKRYYEYRRLDPISMALGLAADFAEISGSLNDDDNSSLAGLMTMALAKNLTNKTYLTGLTEAVNVLSQPDRHGKRWLEMRLGSYVPNLIGQANPDDYMRETRSVLDAVRRRIPGLSESLPPRRNILGEPLTPPAGWLPFGAGSEPARMMSPIGYSESVSDPVKEEIAKLSYGFSMPPKKYRGFDLTQFTKADGQDAHDRMLELHGEVKIGGRTLADSLERLVTSKRYQSLPMPDGSNDQTAPRVQEVQKVITQYRERAKAQMLREYPQIKDAIKFMERQARQSSRPSPIIQRLTQ